MTKQSLYTRVQKKKKSQRDDLLFDNIKFKQITCSKAYQDGLFLKSCVAQLYSKYDFITGTTESHSTLFSQLCLEKYHEAPCLHFIFETADS